MASIETIMLTRFPQLIIEFPHYGIESLRKAAEEQEWDEERTIVELYLDAEGIELEDYVESGNLPSKVEGFQRLGKEKFLSRLLARPPTDFGPDSSTPEDQVLPLDDDPADLPIYLLANYIVYSPSSTSTEATFVPLVKIRDNYEFLIIEANIFSVSIDTPTSPLDEEEDSDSEPQEDTEIDGRRISLPAGSIIESRAHVESDGSISLWLKTPRAWYKFLSPRPDYRPFALSIVGGQARLGRLFTGFLAGGKSYGLEDFLKDEGARYWDLPALRRRLSKDLVEVFGDWEGWEVALSESEFEVSGAIEEFVIEVLVETSTTPSKKKRKVVAKSPLQKKKTKGTPEKFSVATPWIAGLAKGYILGSLLRVVDGKPKSIGGIPIRAGSSPSPGPVATVQTTPGKPSKAKKLTWEALYGLHKLPSASLQLSELEKGEYVLVVAEDGSTHRNIARDNLWIGRVEYTSTKHGKAYVHLRWFCQSRKTLLAEFADEREVCLLKECADVGIENVLRKVEVVKVGKEFTNGGEFGGAGKFYYRFLYDITDASFQDASAFEEDSPTTCPSKCFNCTLTTQANRAAIPIYNPTKEAVEFNGVTYHTLDCIYLSPLTDGAPFHLGILLAIDVGDTSSSSGGYSSASSSEEIKAPEITLTARLLARAADLVERNWGRLGPSTCHKRLYLTCQTEDVSARRLSGRFFLQHKDVLDQLDLDEETPGRNFYEFIEREHCFYVDSVMPPPLHRGDGQGYEDLELISAEEMAHLLRPSSWVVEREALKAPKQAGYELRALDLFSGCGGLTHGMESVPSGIVRTKWAVELNSDAASAFKKNYPGRDLTVFNADANLLLEKAILEYVSGPDARIKMKSLSGDGELPRMPVPGDVDFIYGGPPCQGFSGMNRFQRADCMKNSLIATFLSYVDHYKPAYVLLENVQGLAHAKMHPLDGEGEVVAMGFVKFIVRGLASMGYQVRIGLLQAGQFGVPQSRTRFIFWGARIGVELPQFPAPTHTFEKSVRSLTLFGVDTPERLSMRVPGDNAPHRQVCVGDVLFDLGTFRYRDSRHWSQFPDAFKDGVVRLEEFEDADADAEGDGAKELARFDMPQGLWRNSVQIPDQDDPESSSPLELNWPAGTPARTELFNAVSSDRTKSIGHAIQPYRTTPLNEYQRSFRAFNAYEPSAYTALVQQHVTRPFPAADVQRIVNVPLKAGADHRSLPYEMRPWCLANKDSRAAAHGFYPGLIGRLDSDAAFKTALTKICITGNSGTVLHPRQQRVISVREHARSQGFGDGFIFVDASGGTGEMHTQIGNAVPLPLGRALGRGLHRAVMKQVAREAAAVAAEERVEVESEGSDSPLASAESQQKWADEAMDVDSESEVDSALDDMSA